MSEANSEPALHATGVEKKTLPDRREYQIPASADAVLQQAGLPKAF